MRNYSYSRTLQGGCFVCHGFDAKWFGGNTQGVAARHHDATGHQTWVDVQMSIRYGKEPDAEPSANAKVKPLGRLFGQVGLNDWLALIFFRLLHFTVPGTANVITPRRATHWQIRKLPDSFVSLIRTA